MALHALRQETLLLSVDRGPVCASECVLGARNQGGDVNTGVGATSMAGKGVSLQSVCQCVHVCPCPCGTVVPGLSSAESQDGSVWERSRNSLTEILLVL